MRLIEVWYGWATGSWFTSMVTVPVSRTAADVDDRVVEHDVAVLAGRRRDDARGGEERRADVDDRRRCGRRCARSTAIDCMYAVWRNTFGASGGAWPQGRIDTRRTALGRELAVVDPVPDRGRADGARHGSESDVPPGRTCAEPSAGSGAAMIVSVERVAVGLVVVEQHVDVDDVAADQLRVSSLAIGARLSGSSTVSVAVAVARSPSSSVI